MIPLKTHTSKFMIMSVNICIILILLNMTILKVKNPIDIKLDISDASHHLL